MALVLIASLHSAWAAHPGKEHVLPLVIAEIGGAAALLWRPTRLAGACTLLAVFMLAQVLSALQHQWPTQFLQYAASTLVILALARALEATPCG